MFVQINYMTHYSNKDFLVLKNSYQVLGKFYIKINLKMSEFF